MIGIDLFAGAGGMSLGAEMAGVVTKIAVEMHHAAFDTYRHNHPECTVLQMGVEHLQNLRRHFPRTIWSCLVARLAKGSLPQISGHGLWTTRKTGCFGLSSRS